MKNGILYIIYKFVLDKLDYLTIVYWFKFFASKLNPNKNNQNSKDAYSRTATDIFIILKWIFLIVIIKSSLSNGFLTGLVWYLIITNVYTYFLHHIWKDSALDTGAFEKDRIRRRFVNLILAVGFSDFCFAYLYKFPYFNEFNWPQEKIYFLKSVWFSISNSLAANYDSVKPLTDIANNITMLQLIITFIFITIILGKSIPQTSSTT